MLCYLGTRELGRAGLSKAFSLTPVAIHYALVRQERFLKENEKGGEGPLGCSSPMVLCVESNEKICIEACVEGLAR